MKVGVIGAESSGKSTLCRELEMHYGYKWIKEYAREYVEQLCRPYTEADLDCISQKLIEQVSATYDEEVVLYDTELIVMKVWYAHVYGHVPEAIEEALRTYPMDYYLLLAPDLPAEPDPVRENLDRRDYFFAWYEREIQATGVPYTIIHGIGETRIRAAEEAIRLLQQQIKQS